MTQQVQEAALAFWVPQDLAPNGVQHLDSGADQLLLSLEALETHGLWAAVLAEHDPDDDGALWGGIAFMADGAVVGCPLGTSLAFFAEWPEKAAPSRFAISNDRFIQMSLTGEGVTLRETPDGTEVACSTAAYRRWIADARSALSALRDRLRDQKGNTDVDALAPDGEPRSK